MPWHDEIEAEKDWKTPSLSEMTSKALSHFIKTDTNGFFLMVEGAKIDKAHHKNYALRALHETAEFDKSIKESLETLENSHLSNDTLVIVTADHGHTFSLSNYGDRSDDVDNVVSDRITAFTQMDSSATLGGYYTGPGNEDHGVKKNRFERRLKSAVQSNSASHSAEDVPIYATGPFAHLLTGTHEQAFIGYLMKYASCAGDKFKDGNHC